MPLMPNSVTAPAVHVRPRRERQSGPEELTPREVRRFGKAPKPLATYRRGHSTKRHRRQAICTFDRVRVDPEDRRRVKIGGIGELVTQRPVQGVPRAAQIVEKDPQRWLHVQIGEACPEPKDASGPTRGYDSGVTHTLMDTGRIIAEIVVDEASGKPARSAEDNALYSSISCATRSCKRSNNSRTPQGGQRQLKLPR